MLAASLVAIALLAGAFSPSVRVDHENRPSYGCFHAAIALGPVPSGSQPVYAVIQDDSLAGIVTKRSDIIFQRSTDRGATWLGQDILIKRGEVFAGYPDITTDAEGALYVVYAEGASNLHNHVYCVRSTDEGTTWSTPVMVDNNPSPVAIGWARIVADPAGRLFAAWNGNHTGQLRIWSSVSTDRGATWSSSIRVDDDTVPGGCYHTDIAVQPGTDDFLVVASAPYWSGPGQIRYHSYFYRSTDLGQSFQPGVQLDTFDSYSGQPHVVADAGHIICDYSGSTQTSGNQTITEARTLYAPPDTWGPRVPVTYLDSLHSSELNGNNLAISADGRAHIALMVFDHAAMQDGIFYASSSDHGASWSDRERVNDDSLDNQSDPDIAVDSVGFAYLVWQDGRNNRQEIWFSTNATVGVEERRTLHAERLTFRAEPSICRGFTELSVTGSSSALTVSLFDASGRLIRHWSLGIRNSSFPLDLRSMPSGVYHVRVTAGEETAETRVLHLTD